EACLLEQAMARKEGKSMIARVFHEAAANPVGSLPRPALRAGFREEEDPRVLDRARGEDESRSSDRERPPVGAADERLLHSPAVAVGPELAHGRVLAEADVRRPPKDVRMLF